MIVKILSSSGGFAGIAYNANKVDKGQAELLAVENFGLLDVEDGVSSVSEYVQYLQVWSTNERGMIKNPQFHVAISCEGRDKDAQELKEIAVQYLDKMGYSDNPYIVVFHSDTDNNHVHIVSTRVGVDGLKINDSFERTRSQAAIKEVLGQDIGYELKSHVEKAMKYNFSSEAQFKMLLEQQGVKVNEKEGQYQFIKYGSVGYEIGKNLIDERIAAYKEPDERVRQLKALFLKYKPALTPEQFSGFMREKFGVEVVFHKAKGKDTPYGYSIFDHAKGQVLKGSQVLKLSTLLAAVGKVDMLASGGKLIAALAENEKLGYTEFRQQLSKLGFELSALGQVKIIGEDKPSFSISEARMKQVFYNDRLIEANKFTTYSQQESEVIGRVMFLKKEDINLMEQNQAGKPDIEQMQLMISDKVNSLLATGKSLEEIVRENKYVFAKKEEAFFLIDKKGYAIYNMSGLPKLKIDYSKVDMLDLDKIDKNIDRRSALNQKGVNFDNRSINEHAPGTGKGVSTGMVHSWEQSSGFGEMFSSLLSFMQLVGEGTEKEEVKKKRRRKR